MNEEEAMRLLKALLDAEGVEWIEERGFLRFRLQHGAMLWETACRPCGETMVIYGRFPFRVSDAERARRCCEEWNRVFVRGALYLEEDGSPVYRCTAELPDIYGAQDALNAALRCSAQAVTCCWGKLSGI